MTSLLYTRVVMSASALMTVVTVVGAVMRLMRAGHEHKKTLTNPEQRPHEGKNRKKTKSLRTLRELFSRMYNSYCYFTRTKKSIFRNNLKNLKVLRTSYQFVSQERLVTSILGPKTVFSNFLGSWALPDSLNRRK